MTVPNFDIEQAIYQRFTGPGQKFDSVDLGNFPNALRPGLNVAVMSGKFTKSSMKAYKQQIEIVVLVAAQNKFSERERRRMVHPLAEYVFRELVGSVLKLGEDVLELDEIVPGPWREATTREQFERGESVFEMHFTTASSISANPLSDEEAVRLDSLIAEYRLDPATQNPVATDNFELP
jgi:hypothetical protein